MDLEKEKFLILRKIKYGEADLILHALSSSGEKVSFLARAALKSKKRFGGGVLEPTHFVLLTFKKAKEIGQLNVLQEASLINDFKGLKQSYDHLELALHVLECVHRVSQEGDVNSEFLFNLAGHTLKAIELSKDLHTLKLHFYLKFLMQQGVVQPEPWMHLFLRTPLAQSHEIENAGQLVLEHLHVLEVMIRHYLDNATVS